MLRSFLSFDVVLSVPSALTLPVPVTEPSFAETAALSRSVLESDFFLSPVRLVPLLSEVPEVLSELPPAREELVVRLALLPARLLPPSLEVVVIVLRLLLLPVVVLLPLPDEVDFVFVEVSLKLESSLLVFFNELQSSFR